LEEVKELRWGRTERVVYLNFFRRVAEEEMMGGGEPWRSMSETERKRVLRQTTSE